MNLLAVAVGGALGAVLRWTTTLWVQEAAGVAFPLGTLAVNVTGAAALGFLVVWLPSLGAAGAARDFLAVGLLGAFTTFSTFSYEAVELARARHWPGAFLYVGGSVVLGIVAVLGGMALAMLLVGSR